MNAVGPGGPTGSRADLEQATAEYERSWWRDDAGVGQRCAEVADLDDRLGRIAADDAVTTDHVYLVGHQYHDSRSPLHDAAVTDCVPAIDQVEDPAAFFVVGCPGVGKTTVLRPIALRVRSLLGRDSPPATIDADRVRQALPEYAGGLGSMVVQEEAFKVTYERILPEALHRRLDMMYDTIGKLGSIRGPLELLQSAGYEIHFIVGRAPVDVCVGRAERRALSEDGRLVSPGLIASTFDAGAEALTSLLEDGFPLSSWAVVDTAADTPELLKVADGWADTYQDALTS